MSNCVLCDLVARQIPVSITYETSAVFAFMDIQPINYGHVIIIPKNHVAYLAELDETTGAELFTVTMRMAQAVRNSGVKCEAINLFLADGEAAGPAPPRRMPGRRAVAARSRTRCRLL